MMVAPINPYVREFVGWPMLGNTWTCQMNRSMMSTRLHPSGYFHERFIFLVRWLDTYETNKHAATTYVSINPCHSRNGACLHHERQAQLAYKLWFPQDEKRMALRTLDARGPISVALQHGRQTPCSQPLPYPYHEKGG